MTFSIHSGRSNFGRRRTRLVLAGRLPILAVFAVLAIGSLVLPNSALAQIADNPDPISLGDLFTAADSVDLTPEATAILQEAAAQGQAQGNCPKGTITIIVTAGDELFQEALAQARREIVEQALGDQAVDYRLEYISDGFTDEVKVEYGRSDHEPPRLDVVWTPPTGSEVQAGDTITARITAYDDTDTFQTGIASISMAAGNEAPFGHDYPQPLQNCEAMPPAQQMEGFYVVPDPAPAMVNMRATAKDFAGNETDLLANFPTPVIPCASGAQWTGSIRGIHKPSWGHQVSRTADVVRLCEMAIVPPLQYLTVGQPYYIELVNHGSEITYVHSDAGDPCRIFGQGTSEMTHSVGMLTSVLEAISDDGELQWSVPTYWLLPALAGTYTYKEICPHDALGPQTNVYDAGGGGWPVYIGYENSEDPLGGSRRVEGNRMEGSYVRSDGISADWSLTRGSEGPIYPKVAP